MVRTQQDFTSNDIVNMKGEIDHFPECINGVTRERFWEEIIKQRERSLSRP